MKRKCKNCNTIFYFKAKDLIPLKNTTDSINNVKNQFIVNCTYCYSEKIVFYNHKPRKTNNNPKDILNDLLKDDLKINNNLDNLQSYCKEYDLSKTSNLIKDYEKMLISQSRLSRNEMIDNILNKSVIKQLVSKTKTNYNPFYITISLVIIGFLLPLLIAYLSI